MTLFAPPPEIIKLSAQNPFPSRLSRYSGTAEKRSDLCGSRVVVDINIDNNDTIIELGTKVQACAFSQAATTLMANSAIGKTVDEVVDMQKSLEYWISGRGTIPNWPNIEHLRPERLNAVRKSSVQLAFKALAEAALAARNIRNSA